MLEHLVARLPLSVYLNSKWWSYRALHPSKYKRLQSQRVSVSAKGYSYRPYDETNSLFIHIPKCGGVSINQALYGGLAGGHQTLDHYIKVFSPQTLIGFFKFTVVRNPWDRLVSAYFFLKNGGFGTADRDWFDYELSKYSNFEDFVISWLNKDNIWKWQHFRPQHHYFLDRMRALPLDFIGRMEHLEEDFDYITKQMHLNVELPRYNVGDQRDYRDYYNHKTKQIVAQVYAEDIALLDYSF